MEGKGHTGIEKGIGKLLAFSQRALDDLEFARVGEEVTDGLIRGRCVVRGVNRRSGSRRAIGIAVGLRFGAHGGCERDGLV